GQFENWDAEDRPAQVMDFEPDQDNLVVLYSEDAPEPEITIEEDEGNSDVYHVMADGEVIATVHSETPVTQDNIALVGQSAA
ncbi:MAG: hypothetical protein AAFZ10_10675, partial [Pseudomonadota bacterium]